MSAEIVDHETGEIESTINYRIHPAADLFPLIEGEAFRAFVEDIRTRGQEVPVVLAADGSLLDGRNRARACQALGIVIKETRYTGDDPFGFVVSHNMQRRHLTESQRAMVAARLATMQLGDNQHGAQGPPIGGPTAASRAGAAAALNVGTSSVDRAKSILKSEDADLIKRVENGEISVNKAAEQVKAKKACSLPASPEAADPGALSRADKAEMIRHLAKQGWTSEQMHKEVGYSTPAQVRELAREFDIEIPGDVVRGRTRRIDHARVLDNVTEAIEVAAMSLRDIDPAQLVEDEALERLDSLTTSINAIAKAVKKIKESFHD